MKKNKNPFRVRTALTMVVLTASLFSANALAFRCGNALVNVGDKKADVLDACGEPLSRETIGFVDQVTHVDRVRVMKLEEWIYQFSSGSRRVIFEFEGNLLINIDTKRI